MNIHIQAQHYTLEQFDIDNGLPSNTIYKVVQDKDGYIWIGTANGLCRYNGIEFKNYTNEEILSEDMPWLYLYNDKVWCLTWSGKLGYIEHDSLYTKHFEHISANSTPRYFLADRQGGYWIKIVNNTAVHYGPDGTCEILDFTNHQLYQDHKNNIYGFGSGVSYYNKELKKFQCLIKKNEFAYNFFDYNVSDDIFWSQNNQYCFVHKNQNLDSIVFKIPLGYTHKKEILYIKQVLRDKEGRYWVHNQQQIFLYDAQGNLVENITDRFMQKGFNVNMLFIDRENNTWICTNGNGLYLLKNRRILNYSNLHENYITHITGSPDGNILMAHQSGKLSLMDQLGRMHFFSLPQTTGSVFYGLHFYMGSFYGIINKQFFQISSSLLKLDILALNWNAKNIGIESDGRFAGGHITAGHWVYSYLQDKEGIVWLGTNKGLYMIPASGKCAFPYLYTSNFIRSSVGKNKGGKWTSGIKADTIDIYKIAINHSTERNNTYINQVIQDSNGIVWIATQCEGVLAYQKGRLLRFTQANGLASNNINSIYADDNGRIWISTNAGVSCILPNGKINTISTEDGILSNQVNGVYLYHDSLLYIGTAKGLSIIDISQRQNFLPSAPVVTSLKLGNKFYHDYNRLHVNYWQNDLLIEYISISFKSKVKYKYLIEGLTDHWEITENRSIHLPKLAPGDYVLKIKTVSQNGVESKDTTQIDFTIGIPFWQWKSFWAFLFLMLITGIYIISNYRQKRKLKTLQLKHKIDELERKALLSQINPHFIFNCLSAIKYLLATGEIGRTDDYLQKFAVLMRDTLDFSESKLVSLTDELRYIANYLSLEKLRFSQFFDYEIEVEPGLETNNILIPPMLLQPFIENAIRHGLRPKKNGKGKLVVSFHTEDQAIIIRIDDDGIGRKASLLLKDHNNIQYQSKGMNISEQRAALQGIEIEIIDKENHLGISEGTTIILKIKPET